jgi:hypothetical protein
LIFRSDLTSFARAIIGTKEGMAEAHFGLYPQADNKCSFQAMPRLFRNVSSSKIAQLEAARTPLEKIATSDSQENARLISRMFVKWRSEEKFFPPG